jgi:hypothetical protein
MMARLRRFLGKPRADRRLLMLAALLHVLVAMAVRLLPFGRVHRPLAWLATAGGRREGIDDVETRVVQAVRSVSALMPAGNCLTEALVAQCLLARYGCEATLRFGVARIPPSGRPFDAHAWLERRGTALIGARAIAYEPLEPASGCGSSPSPR